MSRYQASHHSTAAHSLNHNFVFLDVSVRMELCDHCCHRVLCQWAAKIRRPCRATVSRLGNRHSKVPSTGKLIQHAPLNKIFAARPRPFLVSVQKYHCGPWSGALRLFEKIFDLLRRIVRMRD